MTENSVENLLAHSRQTIALEQAAGLLSWDQETMMPPDGIALRAEQAAALEAAIHARRTDPRIGEWLAAAGAKALSARDARNITLLRRHYVRAVRVPEALCTAIAKAASTGRVAWAAARQANRFADFAPALAEIVSLKREEATCVATGGMTPYDALIDEFEPGMTSAALATLFDGLRGPLTALRARIAEAAPIEDRVSGNFPALGQRAFCTDLAPVFGYRLEAGRIDLALHPFCAGNGGDVRITTRIDEADPLASLYSTIHEMGHAVYEQNIPAETLLTPVGTYASMGVHESQSRMFENQIGRSRAFADWLFGQMKERYGGAGVAGTEELFRAINRVETGFIRTEADEVHYNLHIILRFELERDLVDGRLEVADLEDAWNARFAQDFGREVPSAAAGVLQDIHWSQGLFGYFPTYTLGNIYAAELFAAMRGAIPDICDRIANADLGALRDWLGEKIHARGNMRDPEALIAEAVGHPPTAGPLVGYLEAKFGDLYRL